MTIKSQSRERAQSGRGAALIAGFLTIGLAVAAALLPLVDWAPKARLVGWLLFVAGLAELGFGAARTDSDRVTAIASGLLTAAAGWIFISNPFAPYLPVANLVMLWLLARGAWVLGRGTFIWPRHSALWLGLSGAVDVVLGLLLASGLPVALVVIAVFGPTPEIVAKFSFILATSFLVTGLSELAISGSEAAPAQRHSSSA